jgi:hypothetical protein
LLGTFEVTLPDDDDVHGSKHVVIRCVYDKINVIVVPTEENPVFSIETYRRHNLMSPLTFPLYILVNNLTVIS